MNDEKTLTLKEALAEMEAQKRAKREAEAAAQGKTIAELDAADLAAYDEGWRLIREREAAMDAARKAAKRAERLAKGEGAGAVVQAPPSGPLRLDSALVWQCDECNEWSHEPADLKLYECKECGNKFNENDAEGDNANKCPDCVKRGRKIADQSCEKCDQGPVQEIEAFLCPIGGDDCEPLEDESAVAIHLNDCHAGEFPDEWMDENGGLVLDEPPAPPANRPRVFCARCGASIPAEESVGDEGRDYCLSCAGVL